MALGPERGQIDHLSIHVEEASAGTSDVDPVLPLSTASLLQGDREGVVPLTDGRTLGAARTATASLRHEQTALLSAP